MRKKPEAEARAPGRVARSWHLEVGLLAALAGLVIFPGLGQNYYWANREARHAEVVREMVESRDYLIPTLLGEPYYQKPPIMHAAAAFLARHRGAVTMTIVRLPSALAGVVVVLATYLLGWLLLDRVAALVGAIFLLAMPGFGIMARQARPDMVFCAAVMLACLCLLLGMQRRPWVARLLFFTLGGAFVGIGTVTKGVLGLLIPLSFCLLAPIGNRALRPRSWCWAGLPLGVVLTGGLWLAAAYHHDQGNYLSGVLSQPDLKALETQGRPWYDVFFYLWNGIFPTLPILAFLPLGIAESVRRKYSPCLAIAGVLVALLSLVPKKRPHYLLPVLPFLALGVAPTVVRVCRGSPRIRRCTWMLIGLCLAAMPVYYALVLPHLHPDGEADMFFMENVLAAIEPGSTVYCLEGAEELAWVAQRSDFIRRLSLHPSAREQMNRCRAHCYLIAEADDLRRLTDLTGAIPHEIVLGEGEIHPAWLLYRINARDPGDSAARR